MPNYAADAVDLGEGLRTQVWVDGQRWHEVYSLTDAGPEDEVFVLDRDTGRVEFGEGVHGQRLPRGAEVVVSVYRHGAGATGGSGDHAPPIQPSRSDVVDRTHLALWTVIRTQTSSISAQTNGSKTPPTDQYSRCARLRLLSLAVAFAVGVVTGISAPRTRPS